MQRNVFDWSTENTWEHSTTKIRGLRLQAQAKEIYHFILMIFYIIQLNHSNNVSMKKKKARANHFFFYI